MISKVKIDDLIIGNTYFVERWDFHNHKPIYEEVIITDISNKIIRYTFKKDNWKEYIRFNQYNDFGFYKEDGQLCLF